MTLSLFTPEQIEACKAQPRVKPGELWAVDDHRVYCGDATEPKSYRVLLCGDTVQTWVTSPPYNIALSKQDGGRTAITSTANWAERMRRRGYSDDLEEGAYQDQQAALLALLHEHTKPGGACFYNHKHRSRNRRIIKPDAWIDRTPWGQRQEIVWDRRGGMAVNAGMFVPSTERIYWLEKDGERIWIQPSPLHTDLWCIPSNKHKNGADPDGHPCPFPPSIPQRAIRPTTRKGDLVGDCYGGRGTTAEASATMGRVSATMDTDPHWCDVALTRLERVTGKTARRV